jgi:predicted transcriptional regulator
MDTQVVALDCTYSWRKAADNFLDANLKSIAVMKQNQVVGYVTQQSMLKSLSELIPMSV